MKRPSPLQHSIVFYHQSETIVTTHTHSPQQDSTTTSSHSLLHYNHLKMNSNTDYSIISAAQALLSLAPPPPSKRSDDVRHHHHHHQHQNSASSIDFYRYDTTATPSMVDDVHYVTATPSLLSHSENRYNYSTTTGFTTGYPKILNVPQQRPGSTTSCASSLDDGVDNHSQSSSIAADETTRSGVTHTVTHDSDTANIAYRPQRITSYFDESNVGVPKTTPAIAATTKYRTKKDSKKSSTTSKQKQGAPSGRNKENNEATTKTTTAVAVPPTYYEGSVSLRLKEDEFSLSPLHCFMRQYCVEAFTASADEVTTPRYGKSHGRSISIGQVGIQCVYCKHRPYWLRQERAVCFPSTLKNIYHSIETWQRRHSIVCNDIPLWAKDKMAKLMGKSRSGAGGRRQYWEESAGQLGMVDTPTGIRFIFPPGTAVTSMNATNNENSSVDGTASTVSSDEEMTKMSMNTPTVTASNSMVGVEMSSSMLTDTTCIGGKPVVQEEDRQLVTDFLFTLLNQMETCYFSEQDRIGGRSKVKDCPTGYPGLQCKHCGGKAGFGRYYPVSIQALTSANSDRNIYNHVEKCRRCPSHIREQLEQHLNDQIVTKNRRGNRKEFFQRIWERMHGPIAENERTPAVTNEDSDDQNDVDHQKEPPLTKPNTVFHYHQQQQHQPKQHQPQQHQPQPQQHQPQQHQPQQHQPQVWRRPSNDSNEFVAPVVVSNNNVMGHQHQQRSHHPQPNEFYQSFNNYPSQQQLVAPPSEQFLRQQMLLQYHQRFNGQQQQQQQHHYHQQQRQPHTALQPPHRSIGHSVPFYALQNPHQN